MTRLGIIGASGYTSSELLRLIAFSPKSELKVEMVTSKTHAGKQIGEILPNLRGMTELKFEEFNLDRFEEKIDLAILAVPHTVAMEFVPQLLERNIRTIDFSADYRLNDREVYEKWYDVSHSDRDRKAIYGLPELHRDRIREAKLVANPGCYPTGSILALMPLLKTDFIDRREIIIDAKSGISGAGRNPKSVTHFPNREANLTAYSVGTHRHTPEIEQEFSRIAGEKITLNFVPHLVPMTRGIFTTIYAKLKRSVTTKELVELYETNYENEPFVRFLPKGQYPQTKAVIGSNFCEINLKIDRRTDRVIVMSAIDNLMKGASGTALQNINLMVGREESAKLMIPGLMP